MAAKTRWTPLNWRDPFELDSQLSQEQRMVRDSAQQYAQSALAPRVKDAYRQESTDPNIFREMGEMGLLEPRSMATAAPASTTSATARLRARLNAWTQVIAP